MDPFLGQVMLFAGNFAPRGWAFCDGQLLPIAQYSALFSILGTTYGGDGRTTFKLPDLRSSSPMHAGTGPGLSTRQIGQKFGLERNTMNVSHLPSHTHTLTGVTGAISGSATAAITGTVSASMNVANANDGSDSPNGKFLGQNDGGGLYNGSPTTGEQLAGTAISVDQSSLGVSVDTSGLGVNLTGGTVAPAGGGQSVNNIQPVLVINHIIALQGTFPSRS